MRRWNYPPWTRSIVAPGFAQTASTGAAASEIPPILFVHGNGDHAALWITTLWRMESNGVPRERLFAINFTDPLAGPADGGTGSVIIMTRPRSYFGVPRDSVLLDGKEPADVKLGMPTDSTSTLRLPTGEAGRPVVAIFDQERIVARAWPASENRIVMAGLTY